MKGDETMYYPYPTSDDEQDNLDYWNNMSDDIMKASSGTDCTGLMPTAPLSEYEFGSYADLYDFLPSVIQDSYEERR